MRGTYTLHSIDSIKVAVSLHAVLNLSITYLHATTNAVAAAYMRRNKMKIGDVIAITRRPDAQLVSRDSNLHVPT